jgi:transposase
MTYSLDLRRRVLSFIEEGGSQREAMRIFKISRNTMYRWRTSLDPEPKKHGSRMRKIDPKALARHVQEHCDAKLSERAAHFGVRTNAIWYQLQKMKLVKKSA